MGETIIVYTDGGSRGNPGPAAAAFVVTNADKKQLLAKAFFLGQTTNNVAEYTGLLKSLQTAKEMNVKEVLIFSDSELMVRQINGYYAVKSENLRPLYEQCLNLLDGFATWKMQHIPRENNKKADSLVNLAMERQTDIEEFPEEAGEPIRIGVLISGGGRTMMNILEHIKTGKLNAEITVVISSRSDAAGVEKAKKAGLNVKIIKRKDFADIDGFSRQIAETLDSAKVDLAVQAGWLCLWKIPDNYINRVMNIHPALLPSFGGQGMWGHHVHEAVLKAGCKISGCTVHFCTNEYDKGPIIIQRCCYIADNDTPETLAERVFEQECIAYPEAIRLFAQGRLLVQDGIVKINKSV